MSSAEKAVRVDKKKDRLTHDKIAYSKQILIM
jgi:hypothetical protein